MVQDQQDHFSPFIRHWSAVVGAPGGSQRREFQWLGISVEVDLGGEHLMLATGAWPYARSTSTILMGLQEVGVFFSDWLVDCWTLIGWTETNQRLWVIRNQKDGDGTVCPLRTWYTNRKLCPQLCGTRELILECVLGVPFSDSWVTLGNVGSFLTDLFESFWAFLSFGF